MENGSASVVDARGLSSSPWRRKTSRPLVNDRSKTLLVWDLHSSEAPLHAETAVEASRASRWMYSSSDRYRSMTAWNYVASRRMDSGRKICVLMERRLGLVEGWQYENLCAQVYAWWSHYLHVKGSKIVGKMEGYHGRAWRVGMGTYHLLLLRAGSEVKSQQLKVGCQEVAGQVAVGRREVDVSSFPAWHCASFSGQRA